MIKATEGDRYLGDGSACCRSHYRGGIRRSGYLISDCDRRGVAVSHGIVDRDRQQDSRRSSTVRCRNRVTGGRSRRRGRPADDTVGGVQRQTSRKTRRYRIRDHRSAAVGRCVTGDRGAFSVSGRVVGVGQHRGRDIFDRDVQRSGRESGAIGCGDDVVGGRSHSCGRPADDP